MQAKGISHQEVSTGYLVTSYCAAQAVALGHSSYKRALMAGNTSICVVCRLPESPFMRQVGNVRKGTLGG